MGQKGQTEQFTARIDSRIFAHIDRLATKERKSRNEVLNILLKLGLIELSKKKRQGLYTPLPPTLPNRITNSTLEKQYVTQ